MLRYFVSPIVIIIVILNVKVLGAQNLPQQELDSVTVSSTRIDLPFKENSRTINIITKADIKNSATVTVTDLLQQVAGVDIRRRGTGGSQADLYIRGGNYNQTLLLVDGIKMDDAHTGHHTMNALLPIEVIERIEVIKGPAARVFGQNAFTGAINIVTKKSLENTVSTNLEVGSFGQLNGNATAGIKQENASHIIHLGRVTSQGYRANSDYDNANYFVKSTFNKHQLPIEMITSFMERKFGAQDFYTNGSFSEYEETQNSIIGFNTTITRDKLKLKPRVYWRRNQDRYLLVRDNPSSRNFHVNNKIGAEINSSYNSKLGITGFGLDVAQVYLKSNALGDQSRFMTNMFLEHRFTLLNNKLDITPGLAANYFSDFGFNAFPGIDIGYKISNSIKLYANAGYTYRVPTYTELFIAISGFLEGNANLDPEDAVAAEIGFKYLSDNFRFSAASFYRNTNNLIDYQKASASSPLIATNLPDDIRSLGFEMDANYSFSIGNLPNQISANYTFIDDDVKDLNVNFLRYSVNSIKHQFSSSLRTKLIKALNTNIVYRHIERTSGLSYNVWDASLILALKNTELTLTANNILNEDYVEQGIIPMPPSNILFGLRYTFK